jgi:uncharacterized protein
LSFWLKFAAGIPAWELGDDRKSALEALPLRRSGGSFRLCPLLSTPPLALTIGGLLSMNATTTAIGVICKAPRAGASKTRLVPALGAERAAALSRAFLTDLAGTILTVGASLGAQGYAVCSPASAAEELASFLPASFGYLIETDPVLGEVLDRATAALLSRGHAGVILVNGDSPTLPPDLLCRAIEELRRPGERVVFGPALDGGYTMIGVKTRARHLFTDIPWSSDQVLSVSLTRAAEAGLAAELIDPWYDIDDEPSLAWLRAELNGDRPPGLTMRGAEAPATRAILASDD